MKKLMQAFAIICALGAGVAWGQATNSADVSGTVTDTTGAVIPGVTVTVKDLDKGTERILTTNDAGLYDTGPIVPEDHYTLTFTKEGFSTLQRGPMILRVGVIGMNVQLSVGQTTQQVVVNDAAPLLETATPEISSTLASESLQVLPQVGAPDWQSFIVLMPGTSGTPQNGNSASNPGMGGVSANGSMPFSNALLDGASTSSPMSNNVINTPIFDTIGEVKISASLFSAQYGVGGILYNQISKGGSNTFHGMAYDYVQNTSLKAANYAFGTGKITPIHYNDFGFQVGGPVIKNKIFFFFDWDHTINHGGASVNLTTVPTTAMLGGDFTGFAPIYDPTTQVYDPVTGVVTRQSFADEYGNGNKIPSGMLDPVAKALQALYPAANLAGSTTNGVTTNNYQYVLPSTSKLQKWFGRFDADVTKSHRVSGSSAYNYSFTLALSPICPVNCTNVDIMNTNNQISDVWTISPTLLNEARAGFMGEYDLLNPVNKGQGWPSKLGLQFAKQDIFPTVNVTGWYSFAPGTNANYKENLFDLSDVVTMIRGGHVLHIGGEAMISRADSTAWGNINAATLGFTGVYTQLGNTKTTSVGGSPYADFLLGWVKSWSAGFSPEYGGRQKSPAIFVQDDWKLTPKLTINLGLRWDGRTGWSDNTKNERSFDPTITNPTTNTLGAMWFAETAANGRTTLQHSQMNVWLPRVGFAYQLGSKTTMRGGFGMYTFPWNVDTYGNGLGNAKSYGGNATDSTGNVQPMVILSSDGNTNYQGSKGSSVNALYLGPKTNADAYNGQSVGFSLYQSPVPKLKSWNLTVQRQLTGDMMAEVAYVGSRGDQLPFNVDINQVPESKLGPNDSAYRPYPQFQSITGVSTAGISNYNSMQAGITRRMNNGLMFNFNYTWSHMLSNQDSSGWGSKQGNTRWQKSYDPSSNYGASNFDVRNMFKAQVVYDLPFGHGRKYLSNNMILDEAIGGWTLSGTWVGQGGNPFTPYMATDNSYSLASGNQWYPNQIGDPKAGGGTISHWFNNTQDTTDLNKYGAFHAPDAGTFGTMRRNSVYGPGVHVMNASIRKTFKIYEGITFDFSANATNVLNHPSFSQPDALIGAGHTAKITGVTVNGRNMELIGKLRF